MVVLAGMIYGASVFTVVDGAGLADPGVLAFAILILLTTFFFGRGGALVSTTLSIGTLTTLRLLAVRGILDSASSYGAGRLAVLSILLLALAALGWVVAAAWEGSLAELRQTQRRLEMAVNSARVGIWDWDLPSGRLTTSSPWIGSGGLPPPPATIEGWRATLHPDDRERMVGVLEACIRGETPSVSEEYRVRSEEGPWAWRLAMGRVSDRDPAGTAAANVRRGCRYR